MCQALLRWRVREQCRALSTANPRCSRWDGTLLLHRSDGLARESGSSPSSPCLPSPMPLPRAPLPGRNRQSGASHSGHSMPEGMTLGVSRYSVALRRPGSSHPTLWVSPAARAASRCAPGPLTEVSVSRVHRLTVGRDGRSPPSRDSKPSVGLSACKGLCLHTRPKQPPLTLSRQP